MQYYEYKKSNQSSYNDHKCFLVKNCFPCERNQQIRPQMQQARDDKLIVFNPPILTGDGKYRECDLLLLIHGIYDII